MTPAVHITNGDEAAGLLRRSTVMGTVLPWRDVLHEGPVPAGLDLPALSAVRARYIEEVGWAAPGAAVEQFRARDAALRMLGDQPVVLWFEHDLYDQLQLLQLLDWFAGQPPSGGLTLIEVGEFPGVEKFVGLGQLDPSQLASLFDYRQPVSAAQFALGRRAWAAFRSADPVALQSLLAEDTFALPFLQDAVIRLLHEFPWERDGLPRTERTLLEAARTEDRTLLHLFRTLQAREERPFMGDVVVKTRLAALASGRVPLLTSRGRRLSFSLAGKEFWEQECVLTDAGRRALAGGGDWFVECGLERFIGGVRLGPDAPRWRWSPESRRIIRPHANS